MEPQVTPYIFIFIGFSLATTAFALTLNFTFSITILDKLNSHLSKKVGESDVIHRSACTKIIHFFYWNDIVSYSWLILLVYSIFSSAMMLLHEKYLGLWNENGIRFTIIGLTFSYLVIMIILILRVYSLRRGKDSIIPWKSFSIRCLCIWIVIILMVVSPIFVILLEYCYSLNWMLFVFIILSGIHISLILYGYAIYVPISSVLELWEWKQKIDSS